MKRTQNQVTLQGEESRRKLRLILVGLVVALILLERFGDKRLGVLIDVLLRILSAL